MSSKLVEQVAARLVPARTVATLAGRYLGMIANIVRGDDPRRYAAITAAIELIGSEQLAADDAPPEHALIKAYSRVAEIDAALHLLMTMFRNERWMKLVTYEKSSTYSVDVWRMRADAETAYEQYLDADDAAVFAAARAAIGKPPIELVLENENVINKFTIWLFGWAMSVATGDAQRRIALIIERCKDNVLGSAPAEPLPSIVRALPTSASMEPEALWKHANLGEWQGSLDASLTRGDFTAVRNTTGSPMEFDLSGLINASEIEARGLKTAPLSGLTKQVLRRFETVRRLDGTGTTGSITRYGAGTRMIETIDGAHWRTMDCAHTVSTRPQKYAGLQDITANCFDERAPHILRDYAALVPPSTEVLRGRIVDKLMQGFEGRLKDVKTVNQRTWRAIAIDSDELAAVLLETLSEYALGSPESICTYAAKTDVVIRSLQTEINRALDALAPSSRFYAETPPTELLATVIRTHRTALVRAVDELERARVWNEYETTLKDMI